MKNTERILCAAVLFNGKIVAGYRHHSCWATIKNLSGSEPNIIRENNGFLTSHNRFVDRKEGYLIAKANDQLLMKPKKYDKDGILTSECLYFNPEDFFDLKDPIQ